MLIAPLGPMSAYKTYSVTTLRESPAQRDARACAAAGCEPYLYGWTTTLDEKIELQRVQAKLIRGGIRQFQEACHGALTVFTFPAGTHCFRGHPPELYSVSGGHWQGPRDLIKRHANAADWVEDFGEHQQRLADQQAKG